MAPLPQIKSPWAGIERRPVGHPPDTVPRILPVRQPATAGLDLIVQHMLEGVVFAAHPQPGFF